MRARLAFLAPLILCACSGVLLPSEETPLAAQPIAPASSAEPDLPRVVFLGDSITFGLNVARSQAWPAVVAERLAAHGLRIEAINAGVSGDTTTDGLQRLQEVLALEPDVLVVALGGNDATHGQQATVARDNLHRIVVTAQRAGARVLLAGLQLPPALAPRDAAFAHLWSDLARDLDVPLVPDMMKGVFETPGMVQADGVHPTVAGQQHVAANIEPALRDIVRALLR